MAAVAESNEGGAFDEALMHHRAGRLDEAEAIYQRIADSEPNHLGALHMLGVIAHQKRNH